MVTRNHEYILLVDHEFNLYYCAKAHDLPNWNKSDMARNFIASSVSDLEDAGRSASASAMGPAIRDMTTDLLNDWTEDTKFFDQMSKASDGAQMAKLLSTTIIRDMEKQMTKMSQEQSDKIVAISNKLTAYRQEISVGESTSFGIGPEAAMAAFKETTNYIINK